MEGKELRLLLINLLRRKKRLDSVAVELLQQLFKYSAGGTNGALREKIVPDEVEHWLRKA